MYVSFACFQVCAKVCLARTGGWLGCVPTTATALLPGTCASVPGVVKTPVSPSSPPRHRQRGGHRSIAPYTRSLEIGIIFFCLFWQKINKCPLCNGGDDVPLHHKGYGWHLFSTLSHMSRTCQEAQKFPVIIIKVIIQNSLDVKCISVKLQTHCACIIGCWCAFSRLVIKET